MQLPKFGLLWDNGLPWLAQRGSITSLLGLQRDPPWPPLTDDCPHDILIEKKRFEAPDDPLLEAMLPVPQPGAVFYLTDPNDDQLGLLYQLARLCRGAGTIIRPIWSMSPKELDHERTLTNLAPLVLTQCSVRYQRKVDHVATSQTYFPRVVIMTGAREVVCPRPIVRITTQLTEDAARALPLEKIGADRLRRHARKET